MRTKLPPRRHNYSRDEKWQDQTLTVTVGFEGLGLRPSAKEVFADFAKPGSDAHAQLSDGLVLMSYALQQGLTISEISEHLGREGVLPGTPAASVLGFVAKIAAEMEHELALQFFRGA